MYKNEMMKLKPRMVELVDTRDLKSLGALPYAGSSPASGKDF